MDESNAEIAVSSKLPKHSSPLFRKVDGISVIDLIGNPDFPSLSSHRKLIFILLIFTVKDRGSELHFEPCRVQNDAQLAEILRSHYEIHGEDFLRLFYQIDGELLELVPAPGHVWPSMIREFEAMTSLNSPRHRLSSWIRRLASRLDGQPRPHREGHFHLRAGDEAIKVKLVAWPSDWGERIFLTLDPISASLSEQVRAEMKRLGLLVASERRNYLSDPTVHPATSQRGEPLEGETGGDTPEPDASADPESSTSSEAAT